MNDIDSDAKAPSDGGSSMTPCRCGGRWGPIAAAVGSTKRSISRAARSRVRTAPD
jgi:hypothetical protein